MRPAPARLARPRRWLAAAAAVLVSAGAAIAQTPAPPAPQPAASPQAPPAGVIAAPPEEAPPDLAPPQAAEPAPPPVETPEPVAPAAPKTPLPPAKRARYDVAIIQALDKVTAETVRFEAAVGKPVRYKTLVITVRACEMSTEDEPIPDAIAYLTIQSQPKAAPGKPTPAPRQAFRGWMFASSPGLNPLAHPVYDAWLITCRAVTPS